MFHTRNTLQKTLIAGAVAASFAGPAMAQLEEIIVTAQKRSESLQDTPISIAAFDQAELTDMGIFEPGQVAEYTPNLDISRQPSSNDNYGFSIRGVGTGETSLLNENTVGMYLDGVYIARSTGSVFDIVDLERIEVLRGPQGTLYGRNTIGGAINLITEKPREEFAFQQKLTAGNRDFFRSTTTLDTGKLGDMFSAKLTYNYNEKDGLVNNIYHSQKLGEQESNAYRIALRLEPGDNFTADYTYDNSEREGNSAMSQLVATRPPMNQIGGAIMAQATAYADPDRLSGLPLYFADGKSSFSDVEMHTLTLEWNVNDNITAKYIGGYREWDSGTQDTDFGSFPSDGASVIEGFTGTYVPAGEMVSLFHAVRESDNEQTTHELQLLGDAFDQRFQYTLGLYYFEEESNEDNPQRPTLPAEFIGGGADQLTKSFLCVDPTFSNPFACIGKDLRLPWSTFQYGSDNESVAAYGQFTYSATDALDITVGIRYTEDDKKAYLVNSNIGPQTNTADDSWDNTSGSLTLNYAWNDDVRTYATVSTGYRSGGFGARVNSAEDFDDGFDEETVTNYEIGLKSEWMDSRVRLNGAVFYMEYDDQQVNSFKAGAGGASSVVLNAGEAEIKGMELELTALLTDGLRLIFNYGYIDAEYNEFITQRLDPVTALPDPSPDADPVTGNEDISDVAVVARTPENTASAILSYDFQPFSWGQLSARVEANYRDEMTFHDQLNLYDSTDDQTLVNARVTLSEMEVLGGNLMLSAWGRNLTDEEYREWGIDFTTLGFAINSFKEKRSYGVDLVYRYGR
jgi:iron complex outermembrane receptor protein